MSNKDMTLSDALLPVDEKRVREIADGIRLDDASLSITYGAETMQSISRFADEMLGRVRARDAGETGDALTSLMLKVKEWEAPEEDDGGLLARIPLLGRLVKSAERSLAEFNTLAGQVDVITRQLDETMVSLLRDIEVMETLYERNREFHSNLSLYIEAGNARLEQARNEELPKLREEAEKSPDSLAAQKVKDFAEQINRFERRLHDLQLSRAITLQTAPQIRLIQNNDQVLAEKIQTSILSTIPIWKSQMVLALSLQSQRQAAKAQKDVADTTNQLLRRNAEMLKASTLETAREVERSVVDVETLREVQSNLVSTITETLQIAREGREKRQEVERELGAMELDLRDKLMALADSKSQDALQQ